MNAALSKERYCLQDQEWRSGRGCTALGAILMTGSEASVFTLTVITAVRLQAVVRPFAQNKFGRIPLIILSCWVLSAMIAVVPLFTFAEDYFVERIWYKQNPVFTFFEQEQIEIQAKIMIALLKVNSTFHEDIGKKFSWSLMQALISKLNPKYKPARRFGYYSTHGVCLPRLIPSHADKSWGFSLALILINFVLFIFLLLGYIAVYKGATKTKIRSSGSEKRAAGLQRKVARIVLSDMICWMPICIIGFIHLSGIDISTDFYVAAGMIILPLNSALNPFLYSDLPDVLGKKILAVFRRIRSQMTEQQEGNPSPQVGAANGAGQQQQQRKRLVVVAVEGGNFEQEEQQENEIIEMESMNRESTQHHDINQINHGNAEESQNSLEMVIETYGMAGGRGEEKEKDSMEMDDIGQENAETQQNQEVVERDGMNNRNAEEQQQDFLNMDDANQEYAETQQHQEVVKTYVMNGGKKEEEQQDSLKMDDENQEYAETQQHQEIVEIDGMNGRKEKGIQQDSLKMDDANQEYAETQQHLEVIETDGMNGGKEEVIQQDSLKKNHADREDTETQQHEEMVKTD